MTKARVVKWLKQEGEPVAAGDSLVEIETDKAVVEVEAEASGTLGKIMVEAGGYAEVNAVIGLLLEKGESANALAGYTAGQAASASAEREAIKAAAEKIVKAQEPFAVAPAEPRRTFASPLARRLAKLEGLELAAMNGSGPNGRVVKWDVEMALAAKPVQTLAPAVAQAAPPVHDLWHLPHYESIELSAMRKTIARRLTDSSQQIPHYYLSLDCELDQLMVLRKQLNSGLDGGAKISLNDFIIRAVALAMKRVPNANVMWNEDSVLRFDEVDISVAVAIDGGLITPVVRKACRKGLAEISKEMNRLADKARNGKLLPEEYQGGTFTISNLGMYGIKNFTSIINPPQSGILSVGAGEHRPVVKDGELTVATVMTVTLAADHRCLDGAVGAEFLATFKGLIEAPMTMLL
jgi:pyruvate dehydrogenase E2 component (dihydrolipoamide acetyltransferase)